MLVLIGVELSSPAAELAARVADAGALAFAAHPFSECSRISAKVGRPHPWGDLAAPGLTGIELWSLETDLYDNIVHVSLTAFSAPVFYTGLARLDVVPDLADETQHRHRLGVFVITFSLAMAFGAVYEVYEWAANHLVGAHLIISETDMVNDLFDDMLGGALLVVWAIYGWGTTRRVAARRLSHQPPPTASADTSAGATSVSAALG